jgi:predicted translin family RNA/ssDNA-binding protein
VKWTRFSADIVRVCNELIGALEERNINAYSLKLDQQLVHRSLPQIKDKILKYDAFLQKNKHDLDSKEYAQSLGLVQQEQN